MKISKSDRKYLSREGFLSLSLCFVLVACAIFCKSALDSDIFMTFFLVGFGYCLGNSVAYLRIAYLK